jgi:glycosyltransferase involved in cell wall biosynthesis
MKALKILHSESSQGWGGQEHRTLKEMIALRARGHTVEVVCPRDARLGVRSAEEGFAVHHARMRGAGDVRSMLWIKALLSRRSFDVVNTHSGHDSLVAGTAGRLANTPLVVRTRHLALPISSLATYTWIPHRVIAVSRYVRQYLISAGVAEERVETIYDGIAKPEVHSHSTLRNELGLDSNAIVAGMVAIMRDKKGHEDLIAAAQPMLAERPDLHFVMAGDGPWFEKIKNIVDALGLGHRIHLLGFRSDVPNVLRGCDLFVLPTHQEALGQSYIEAMAEGLPVIGTNVDGVPEVITHGVNGLLVPPHDIEALRAAIAGLIDNPGLRAQLGVAGRLLTNLNFTIDAMADETIDLYRRGISERRARA